MTLISPARIFVIPMIVAAISLAGCTATENRDAERLAADSSATTELNRINTLLATPRPVTRIDIDSLRRLRDQYPGAPVIRQLLQAALIKREDWAEAEKLIAEIPDAEKQTTDKLNLAKIHFKQGRFEDATTVLRSMPTEIPERVEVAALLGQSLFYRGEYDQAMQSLESVQTELVAKRRSDDLALLGAIYTRRGEHQKAIDVLLKAVEASPESVAANNALARAYAAYGDSAKAEEFRTKLQAIYDRIAASEKRKSRLVPLQYQLEDAYEAKDYPKVIELVEQIRPEADDATQATLYQYLVAAYRGQGNETAAQKALAEASKQTKK